MSSEKITINALVSAEINKAWNYYTMPEHITKWNFASDDWCCPSVLNDMTIGGKYVARMEAKDGSFGFDFEAIYNEINKLKNFKYTSPDGRLIEIDFEANDNQTKLTITFDTDGENPIELQRNGWQAILNNYKNYTENN